MQFIVQFSRVLIDQWPRITSLKFLSRNVQILSHVSSGSSEMNKFCLFGNERPAGLGI